MVLTEKALAMERREIRAPGRTAPLVMAARTRSYTASATVATTIAVSVTEHLPL